MDSVLQWLSAMYPQTYGKDVKLTMEIKMSAVSQYYQFHIYYVK